MDSTKKVKTMESLDFKSVECGIISDIVFFKFNNDLTFDELLANSDQLKKSCVDTIDDFFSKLVELHNKYKTEFSVKLDGLNLTEIHQKLLDILLNSKQLREDVCSFLGDNYKEGLFALLERFGNETYSQNGLLKYESYTHPRMAVAYHLWLLYLCAQSDQEVFYRKLPYAIRLLKDQIENEKKKKEEEENEKKKQEYEKNKKVEELDGIIRAVLLRPDFEKKLAQELDEIFRIEDYGIMRTKAIIALNDFYQPVFQRNAMERYPEKVVGSEKLQLIVNTLGSYHAIICSSAVSANQDDFYALNSYVETICAAFHYFIDQQQRQQQQQAQPPPPKENVFVKAEKSLGEWLLKAYPSLNKLFEKFKDISGNVVAADDINDLNKQVFDILDPFYGDLHNLPLGDDPSKMSEASGKFILETLRVYNDFKVRNSIFELIGSMLIWMEWYKTQIVETLKKRDTVIYCRKQEHFEMLVSIQQDTPKNREEFTSFCEKYLKAIDKVYPQFDPKSNNTTTVFGIIFYLQVIRMLNIYRRNKNGQSHHTQSVLEMINVLTSM